jgi:hypothetical protein
MFLIRRRPTTSRDELVAHWFANHMPAVIARERALAAQGRRHAWRYLVTVFRPTREADPPWDGVAQLWWDEALPRPKAPFGEPPRDSFQEHIEPYLPWPTAEYVILDGAERLPVRPLTLNAPFPTTRAGFFKVTFLVKTRPETDIDRFYAHWLDVHAPNVEAVMRAVGGFRYLVSQSLAPAEEAYAGMAELYFPAESAWHEFRDRLRPDGIEEWLDPTGLCTLFADTEFVGIP